jgi:hypothetical protein
MTSMPTITTPFGSYPTNTTTYCGYGYGGCNETTSTSTTTVNTLVTLTRPYPPSTPVPYPVDDSYTDDTLAGVCPKQCNPFNPSLNYCDITTSCTTSGGTDKHYCACRADFKADYNDSDFFKHMHPSGQPFVYVTPGVVCDQLCDDTLCSEGMMRPGCL